MFYLIVVTLHVLAAGIWLSGIIAESVLSKNISKSENQEAAYSAYLKLVNLYGIIGSMGILLTGVWLVLDNMAYQFFQLSANHWLTTKQVLMVFILILLFSRLIPSAKKLRISVSSGSNAELIAENFSKVKKTIQIINVLVIINLILAITHRLYF